MAISLIIFRTFGSKVWIRNSRNSIKPYNDSYNSRESKKNFSPKNGSWRRLSGDDDVVVFELFYPHPLTCFLPCMYKDNKVWR